MATRRGAPLPTWWSRKSRFPYESFDHPPQSRLFLVLEEKVMTPEVWLRLSSFGPIDDFWPQMDKRTLEPTGAVFVKFARSSDASRALQEMRSLSGWEPGVLQVWLAQSRATRKSRNLNLELFAQIHARVPKTCTEKSVRDVFKVYGDIVSCTIERNKTFGECQVLACIKFSKASEAALAIEQCDKSKR
ncbi:hypothetical protein JD844_022920 [Phrynosoma platyrhinos]|uniref:RRM domain-containing protein n=1 Tax=Phrynosoma platyrhinos TaxID=52577 RepID=A0ABQ7SWA1_PHRPL|nr:hypothetical protein JD844_022920 [Phrynosoma platyrhinos]